MMNDTIIVSPSDSISQFFGIYDQTDESCTDTIAAADLIKYAEVTIILKDEDELWLKNLSGWDNDVYAQIESYEVEEDRLRFTIPRQTTVDGHIFESTGTGTFTEFPNGDISASIQYTIIPEPTYGLDEDNCTMVLDKK